MAQVLHEIAPEWFSKIWLSKIKLDVGDNWRLKVSNLKKIIEAVTDYYHEFVNQNISFVKPDAVAIGERKDVVEMVKLLQLILGCAVNCEKKHEYIKEIMLMEESIQSVIMQSIQELETLLGSTPMSLSSHLNMGSGRGVDMDDRDCALDTATMDCLKEEIFKLETARDDYRVKLAMREKEMEELQVKFDSLQRAAAEARHLKDEVDILREDADKAEKLESTLKSYKKKLEELSELKREMKLLEEKNLNYVQQTLELEEELKKANVWRTQAEMYKKQYLEARNSLNEETKKSDKIEFENVKLREKFERRSTGKRKIDRRTGFVEGSQRRIVVQ
ncbi:Protein Hook 3 [Sarracenia purpurea var. burkii]